MYVTLGWKVTYLGGAFHLVEVRTKKERKRIKNNVIIKTFCLLYLQAATASLMYVLKVLHYDQKEKM